MSKYCVFWEYIQEREEDEFVLNFAEIAQIAGIPIDHSFLNYKKELAEYGYQVGYQEGEINYEDKRIGNRTVTVCSACISDCFAVAGILPDF